MVTPALVRTADGSPACVRFTCALRQVGLVRTANGQLVRDN